MEAPRRWKVQMALQRNEVSTRLHGNSHACEQDNIREITILRCVKDEEWFLRELEGGEGDAPL